MSHTYKIDQMIDISGYSMGWKLSLLHKNKVAESHSFKAGKEGHSEALLAASSWCRLESDPKLGDSQDQNK